MTTLCSQADIRKEERGLERTIRDLQRDSKNAAKQVAVAAKRGDMASARTLAKEIVHTKKVRGAERRPWCYTLCESTATWRQSGDSTPVARSPCTAICSTDRC